MGNQPYNNYARRTQFLKLGEVWVHRSALGAAEERELDVLGGDIRILYVTTTTEIKINTTEHTIDPELTVDSKDKVKRHRRALHPRPLRKHTQAIAARQGSMARSGALCTVALRTAQCRAPPQ